MNMKHLRLGLLLCGLASPTYAQTQFTMPKDESAAQFVTSNVVGTFYHELGHALIDVLQLPVLGREEDAADTLSALLIHDVWLEDSAVAMIQDNANAYLLYDAENVAQGNEPPYWDVHGLDLQRYYNLICLFYGANPDSRADLVKTFELPPERADGCPAEFEQAQASWGAMLDGLEPEPDVKGLRMAKADDPLSQILADEITTINQRYGLPEWVDVVVEPCDEANAFYDPELRKITLCTEYATDLARVWAEAPE